MSDFAVLKLPVPSLRTARQMVAGRGSISALRGLNANRVVFLVGRSLAADQDRLERILESTRAKKRTVIVRDWEGEPDLASIENSLRQVCEARPDAIVAVGGGSVLDGAKILWLLYEHPSLSMETITRPFGLPSLRGRARLVAIPTTVGSGAEVSSSAVLVDRVTQRKFPAVTHDFLPDLAVLDANLLQGLPKSIIASTCCDALAHAVEGYVSTVANPLIDVFAEKAVADIARNAFAALQGDEKALERLQYAAMLAGWVQNHCLVGIAHGIAHQLPELPHSEAVALMLPAAIRVNARPSAERYSMLSVAAGIGGGGDGLAELAERITESGGLSLALPYLDAKRKNSLIAGAIADPAGRANPITVTASLVEELLCEVAR